MPILVKRGVHTKTRIAKKRRMVRRHPVVAQVAKQVVNTALNRRVEWKRKIFAPQDKTCFAGDMYFTNPFTQLAQGTSESTRIGDQINNCYLGITGTYTMLGSDAITGLDKLQQSLFRVMVIKCHQQFNPGGPSYATTSVGVNFPSVLYNDFQLSSFPNRHSYTILADRLVKPGIKPYPIAAAANLYGPVATFKISVPVGNLRYDDAGTYLKGNQIYIIFWAHTQLASTGDKLGALQSTYSLLWKDA